MASRTGVCPLSSALCIFPCNLVKPDPSHRFSAARQVGRAHYRDVLSQSHNLHVPWFSTSAPFGVVPRLHDDPKHRKDTYSQRGGTVYGNVAMW
jgi:hypothetical protein